MLLRASTIILSLVLHGVIGHVLWFQFLQEQTMALDPGEGQDIMLEPQGMDLTEVSNVGDDLQSIETQASVPAAERAPPPPEVASLGEPQARIDGVQAGAGREAPEIAPQEQAPPANAMPEQVRDVIASDQSTVEQEIVPANEPAIERIEKPTNIAPNRIMQPRDEVEDEAQAVTSAAPVPKATSPAQTLDPLRAPETAAPAAQAPPLEKSKEPEPIAPAQAPPLADVKEPEIANAGMPDAPDQIAEARIERMQKPAASRLEPLEEQAPDETIEVIAQPEQAVIVTEQSSGQEKIGGDATATSRYLGQIYEEVKRAKVNPRSRSTGTVIVKFTIGTDGALLSREVLKSSGTPVLDNAAIAALERAAPFPGIPPEVSPRPMTFTQTFRFLVR